MKEKILELWNKGFTRKEIARALSISMHTVNKHTAGLGYRGEVNEKKQLAICLKIDGYNNNEIASIVKLSPVTIKQYTIGVKKHKIIVPRIRKKYVRQKPLAIDQRGVLGKGVESGIYAQDIKLRDNRDEGRLVRLLYSDLTNNPRMEASIRVRDEGISDEVAVERWAKRTGKKSWRVV